MKQRSFQKIISLWPVILFIIGCLIGVGVLKAENKALTLQVKENSEEIKEKSDEINQLKTEQKGLSVQIDGVDDRIQEVQTTQSKTQEMVRDIYKLLIAR